MGEKDPSIALFLSGFAAGKGRLTAGMKVAARPTRSQVSL
jgi:hypothetical protein